MNTIEATTGIPPEVRSELQDALERLARGVRDPDAARGSRERMDRMRNENQKRFGIQNVGVEIIREMRENG